MFYRNYTKPFEPHYIDLLADDMCQADINEVFASNGVDPKTAVTQSILNSDSLVCYFDKDYLLGIGGVGLNSNGSGSPWLLSNNYLRDWKRRNLRTFLKCSRSWIKEMNETYPHLENYVDQRNTESQTWLKHLGFHFPNTVRYYGYLKIPFIKFIKYND